MVMKYCSTLCKCTTNIYSTGTGYVNVQIARDNVPDKEEDKVGYSS